MLCASVIAGCAAGRMTVTGVDSEWQLISLSLSLSLKSRSSLTPSKHSSTNVSEAVCCK